MWFDVPACLRRTSAWFWRALPVVELIERKDLYPIVFPDKLHDALDVRPLLAADELEELR